MDQCALELLKNRLNGGGRLINRLELPGEVVLLLLERRVLPLPLRYLALLSR